MQTGSHPILTLTNLLREAVTEGRLLILSTARDDSLLTANGHPINQQGDFGHGPERVRQDELV